MYTENTATKPQSAESLIPYLQDHLAGARFAVSLLNDLAAQDFDPQTATIAAKLLPEIEQDRAVLENFLFSIGGDVSGIKDAFAWLAQKASRWKLSPDSQVGMFEAIEVLCLGVLGKLALWNALRALDAQTPAQTSLDLDSLCDRATRQHATLESRRLQLVPQALVNL